MNPASVASRAPHRPRALILEDDKQTADQLERILRDDHCATVDVAPDMRSFHRLFDSAHYEALSIDWEIRGSVGGFTALNEARTQRSPAGVLVYTNHVNVRDEAKRFGANEVIEKHDLETFGFAFGRAARYGFAGEVMKHLPPTGAKLPYPLPPGDETTVCERALVESVRLRRAGRTELLDLLKRRGWVSEADSFALADMAWSARSRHLAELCNCTAEQVAAMLRVGAVEIGRRLSQDEPPDWGDPVTRQLDDLNTIYAYTFRISGQHPELVQYYWRAQSLFTNDETAPPWNLTGMADFLISTGPDGLQIALRWIRSH